MSEEELIKHTITYSGYEFVRMEALNEFLSKNVCIPKVENNLPAVCACKNTEKDKEYKIVAITRYIPNNGCYEYQDTMGNLYSIAIFLEYIKPSEPVYEYQFVMNINGNWLTSEYMTQQEWFESKLNYIAKRNEETKRVRQ